MHLKHAYNIKYAETFKVELMSLEQPIWFQVTKETSNIGKKIQHSLLYNYDTRKIVQTYIILQFIKTKHSHFTYRNIPMCTTSFTSHSHSQSIYNTIYNI